MDLNGDGKFDGRDYMLHEEFFGNTSGNGGSSSGGGGDSGCLTWVLVGLVVFQIFKWVAEIIY